MTHVHADAPPFLLQHGAGRHVGAVRPERPPRGAAARRRRPDRARRPCPAPITSSTALRTSRRSSTGPSPSCSGATGPVQAPLRRTRRGRRRRRPRRRSAAAPAPPTRRRSARGRRERGATARASAPRPASRSHRPAPVTSGSRRGGCAPPRQLGSRSTRSRSRSTSMTSWTRTSAPRASAHDVVARAGVAGEHHRPVGRVEAETERREHRRVLDEHGADPDPAVVLGVDHHRLHRRRRGLRRGAVADDAEVDVGRVAVPAHPDLVHT